MNFPQAYSKSLPRTADGAVGFALMLCIVVERVGLRRCSIIPHDRLRHLRQLNCRKELFAGVELLQNRRGKERPVKFL